ncbi:hypothetical protein HID58_024744 [Brassica napus]|uniref:Uncharacterized protein n=1 Tax=Brassica napus TaxID=3708 RepID=A0ABQ8CJ35_BRANA|nr:hypothetical protein HID58_024744 [Brassica napus]
MMNEAIIRMNDNNEGNKEAIGSGLLRDWSELNKECLIDIVSRLSMEERWRGPMLVCKPWMYACDDPSLNSVFDLDTWFEGSRISNLWFSYEFEQKVDSFLRCPSLEVLCLKSCLSVTDASISKIAVSCPNLDVLWIQSCLNVTDASMAKIASSCPKLRELDISHSIEISQKALKMIERSCENVKIIVEPPSNVRLSRDEASKFGLSVRSITRRELLEHIRNINTNDN